MFTWFRTYNAQIGKMDELVKLSQQAVKHLKKNHGLNCELYAQVGGDPTRLGLVGRYKDMGAIGKLEDRISKDAKWAAIMKGARGLVVEGSVQDSFWKEL
jgi:hypothetical protein